MQDKKPIGSVTVEAPARLHLGFLDLNGDLNRRFGSIGLAINEPATKITMGPAEKDSACGPEASRARAALDRFKKALSINSCFDIEVLSAIPAHAGLGSGTQLALAVGAGLRAIENLPQPIEFFGETLSRGARSAIGIGAFLDGGFIIDGGKGQSMAPPPVLARAEFPDEWRVLLVFDPNAVGVHGQRERDAFENLPPMSTDQVGVICRSALMQLLPGLMERDIEVFGAAITKIQDLVGAHFAAAQGGGNWASQHVARVVTRMGELGAHGIGQSSWGPTGFAFVETQAAAEKLYDSVVQDAKGMGLDIVIARGRNQGASITTSATIDLRAKE